MTARIVVQPHYNFGDAFIDGRGHDANALARSAYWGSVELSMAEFNMTRAEVLIACWYYAIHGSAQSKIGKSWWEWARDHYPNMRDDWALVPDPPVPGPKKS